VRYHGLAERSSTRARRVRVAAGIVFGVLCAMGVGLGTWVIVTNRSPVPYADFWGQLPFLERAYGGDLRIADFWVQANEHRILVPRIQFLLDYRLFEGTYAFLFSAIALSSLVLAATFAAVVWLETGDRLLTWGTFCASAVATMSPVGHENLTWAFQVQFVQVFLFASLAILAVVVAARGTSPARRPLWTGACAAAAVAATYSMANGLLVWPVVLVLAVVLRLGLRHAAALGLVSLATVVSYAWHLEFATRGSLSDPVGLLEYTSVYVGSVLRETRSTVAAGALGALGIGLLALLVALVWRRRAGGSLAMPFGAGVALFVLLSALQTAAGRLDLGVAQALSSRYTIASSTFLLALLVGFLTPLRERFGRAEPVASPALLAGAAIVALVIGATAVPSRTFVRTTLVGKETTILGYLVGVDDPSGTLTGGPSGPIVEDSFRWMEEHELGPWAAGGIVDGMRFTFPQAPSSPECLGAVESVEPVTRGLRLRGWLAAPGGEAASRNVALLDGRGRARGRGLVGTHRPDQKEATGTEWSGFVAYARGNPPRPLVLVIVGEDRLTPVCRLEAR
jgi:hypothetical protein